MNIELVKTSMNDLFGDRLDIFRDYRDSLMHFRKLLILNEFKVSKELLTSELDTSNEFEAILYKCLDTFASEKPYHKLAAEYLDSMISQNVEIAYVLVKWLVTWKDDVKVDLPHHNKEKLLSHITSIVHTINNIENYSVL